MGSSISQPAAYIVISFVNVTELQVPKSQLHCLRSTYSPENLYWSLENLLSGVDPGATHRRDYHQRVVSVPEDTDHFSP